MQAHCVRGHPAGLLFRFGEGAAIELRCLRHALVQPQVLRTALTMSAVVGTILTIINQGNLLAGGHFPAQLAWKIPLTYSVPYCVSTFSALRISRVR
ncbi:MAG: nitrate/nitrite transporter NrtS [Chloroflexi bacterium]|nr:nitrate/nitrite transporter NrtS [Chloroflexota bacterium]